MSLVLTCQEKNTINNYSSERCNACVQRHEENSPSFSFSLSLSLSLSLFSLTSIIDATLLFGRRNTTNRQKSSQRRLVVATWKIRSGCLCIPRRVPSTCSTTKTNITGLHFNSCARCANVCLSVSLIHSST